MPILSPQLIHTVCIQVGWEGLDAIEATAYALMSSGGDPGAWVPSDKDERVSYRGLFGLTIERADQENRFGLFNAQRNAREAYRRWVRNDCSWSFHPLYPLELPVEQRHELRTMCGLTTV